MVVTRKIEIYICEDDKQQRKELYDRLFDIQTVAVKVANMTASHLFMLDNTTPYLSEADRNNLVFLGCSGQKATKQNAPYVVASEHFKGKASMSMISSVQQQVRKMYQDDRKQGMWRRSLRSYKAGMPIPYKQGDFLNLRFATYTDREGKEHEGCFFTIEKIPFQMKFGRDRSNNRLVVERIISGEYKMCTSSLKYDPNRNKWYLLLCVDMPQQAYKPKEGKPMFAFLGILNPITCTCDIQARQAYDSGMRVWEIGTKEEFNYGRRQIQEAVRRLQTAMQYNRGGKGRKKKCQAIDRFHDKEQNYVKNKMHLYSRQLVDMAMKHRCDEIVLMKQTEREEQAKQEHEQGDHFVLRNWGYHGLKEMITYKAKMAGIKVTTK